MYFVKKFYVKAIYVKVSRKKYVMIYENTFYVGKISRYVYVT